jgi:hypothetical protein
MSALRLADVNARQRILRSKDGGVSYGQWFLQSLEPDATPQLLKYQMLPANGGSFVIAWRRGSNRTEASAS